jgi:aminoglycoside phosphotransferase (APT) family kinase protein
MTSVFARIARHAGLLPRGPHAETSDAHANLAKTVIDDVSARLGTRCELESFHATRTGSLIVRIAGERAYVAKLPLQPSTEPRLRKSAEALDALGTMPWMTPYLADRCPKIVLTENVSGRFCSVETAVPGLDGGRMLKAGCDPQQLVLSAQRFLAALEKASTAPLEHPGWRKHLQAAIERVERLAERAGCRTGYLTLVSDVFAKLRAYQLPIVYAHGNFWLGNALFDERGDLTGVIDWDCADDRSLPAVDLIYLAIRTHSLSRKSSFGEAVADWVEAESLPFLDDCVAHHCRDVSVPPDLVVPLSYCSWILHLDAHCRFGTRPSTDTQWLHRNVRHVVDRSQRPGAQQRDALERWALAATTTKAARGFGYGR